MLSEPNRILEEARRLNDLLGVDSARMNALKRNLAHVEERQRRLARLYVDGSIPEDRGHTLDPK